MPNNQPHEISKQVYSIAKNLSQEKLAPQNSTSEDTQNTNQLNNKIIDDEDFEDVRSHFYFYLRIQFQSKNFLNLYDYLFYQDPDSSKSNTVERNLEQMINILHLRLNSIEEAAKLRKEYCIQDLKPNSRLYSELLPSITADYDDVGPKINIKETSKSTYISQHKVNCMLNII